MEAGTIVITREMVAVAVGLLAITIALVRLVARLAKLELKVATLWDLVMHELRGRTGSRTRRRPEADDADDFS